MKKPFLVLSLLAVLAFVCGTALERVDWRRQIGAQRRTGMVALLLGDSRRLLANHFFLKADAYFHNGYYPSVFDNREAYQTPHFMEDSGKVQGANQGDEDNFMGAPRNWIDRFGRQFYPSVHTHVTDGHETSSAMATREILPWMRLALELDPENPSIYTVTVYWLRSMGRTGEAEALLRQGLRFLPQEPELLFELGLLRLETHRDVAHARMLWELALRRWDERELGREEPNLFILAQILGQIAKLEEDAGNPAQALLYVKRLQSFSPYASAIADWQKRLQEKLKGPPNSPLWP